MAGSQSAVNPPEVLSEISVFNFVYLISLLDSKFQFKPNVDNRLLIHFVDGKMNSQC